MKTYTFWNNKGGTGKTSLCFQCVVRYAQLHPTEKILVIDLCPQANLSELMSGGMMGNGATNLDSLYHTNPRCSIGGYFEMRMTNPYTMPSSFVPTPYICVPHTVNQNIPSNISLLAGDRLVELQSSYIYSLANTNIPTQNTYACVLAWVKDLLAASADGFNVVFIDTNPSFAIYTQIALAATDYLIIPVMADDSSKRALNNVLSLIYGFNLPSVYENNTFSKNMQFPLPKIHMIVKNRMTQYMGPASSYSAVLQSIDSLISSLMATNPQAFSRQNVIEEVRDFQSTGVVAFAEAKSFEQLKTEPLKHIIGGQDTHLNRPYIDNNAVDIDNLVGKL